MIGITEMTLTSLTPPETVEAPVEDPGGPGVYLTDERDLFRVVSSVSLEEDFFVELEDCVSLDKLSVPATVAATLRRVRPVAA
jgi:hypothetical protein